MNLNRLLSNYKFLNLLDFIMNLVTQYLNQELNTQYLIKNLLIKIILDDIKNMIWYIHYKYPQKFNKKIAREYLKKYHNLVLINYSEAQKNRNAKNIKKKLHKRKFNKIGILKTRNKDNTKYNKNDKFCNARVWNCGFVKNLKNKTIYGGRCCRKKVNNKEYCFQHLKNLKHGDYFKEPSEKLIKHFQKTSINKT